jgi:hypothetical protein
VLQSENRRKAVFLCAQIKSLVLAIGTKRTFLSRQSMSAFGVTRTFFSQRITAKKGDAIMRFVLCILLVTLPPSFAFAAKRTMSLSEAQAAAAKGDADAAAAITMTTDHETCLKECAKRGPNKEQCTNACRPGVCHPGAQQPYCIAK